MQQEQDNGLALTGLPEPERMRALARFQVIRPFLEESVPLTQVAGVSSISLRTARYWVKRYRQNGLAGLARKARNDKDERKLSSDLQQWVEGLALLSRCTEIPDSRPLVFKCFPEFHCNVIAL